MKIIYWGIGKKFFNVKQRMDFEPDIFDDEIVAYVDNNPQLWGMDCDGKIIDSPHIIKGIYYDKIIITSIYSSQIRKQLVEELGVNEDNILSFDEYYRIQYVKWIYKNRYQKIDFKEKSEFNTSKLVIYTAIMGDYDNLKEPEFVSTDIEYVCFTNNQRLKSNIWNIEYIDNKELDDRKLSRLIKLQPHIYFKEYETSVWIDGKFQIRADIRKYIRKYQKEQPILCFPHFERNCIYTEAAACIYGNRGNIKKIIDQICRYYMSGYPFDNGVYETGCIVRKHNDDLCIKIMNEWKEEIERFSLRDQISFPVVCYRNNFEPDICDLFVNDNIWIKSVEHNRHY